MFSKSSRSLRTTFRNSAFLCRFESTAVPKTPAGVNLKDMTPELNRSFSEFPQNPPSPELPNSYHRMNLSPSISPLVSSYMARIINAKVYSAMTETPLMYAPKLSDKLKNRILLKREDLTPVFSFKLRGAFNKMASLSLEEKARGVVACSAGNHAQGVGFAAKHLGVRAKIFMPALAPQMKIDAVRAYGVEVILVDGAFSEAEKAMRDFVAKEGWTVVHPFDDPAVIAGQGTIGLEIMKQLGGNAPDGVFLSCGGGGMLAGVGAFLKATAPDTKVIGANSLDSPGMTESLKKGHRVRLAYVGNFADGAAVALVGKETFKVAAEVVDEMMAVSTEEICSAIKDIFAETRVVCEPAGALSLAALKKYISDNNIENKTFVAVVSGANMDFDKLRFVAERADQSESLLCVDVPERPGALALLMKKLKPRPVTEFACRIEDGDSTRDSSKASVFVAVRCSGIEDETALLSTLQDEGYPTLNLTKNSFARQHGRFLVGGRAPISEDANEEVLTFEFFNSPGALYNFVEDVSYKFNASLWSYRNFGHDMCRVLVGFQVPMNRRDEFEDWLKTTISTKFKISRETGNPMYTNFLRAHELAHQSTSSVPVVQQKLHETGKEQVIRPSTDKDELHFVKSK